MPHMIFILSSLAVVFNFRQSILAINCLAVGFDPQCVYRLFYFAFDSFAFSLEDIHISELYIVCVHSTNPSEYDQAMKFY